MCIHKCFNLLKRPNKQSVEAKFGAFNKKYNKKKSRKHIKKKFCVVTIYKIYEYYTYTLNI